MKKRLALVLIALLLGVWPVTAQKIETQAAGSQAFKVEWRENKVFIEPTEPNVSTNLFIWTKSGRLNYELDPAGTVAQMHFAIDQPALDPPALRSPETPSGRRTGAAGTGRSGGSCGQGRRAGEGRCAGATRPGWR